MTAPRIVIVGAGTAGFNVIATLCELAGDARDVTLVSPEVPYARMVLPYYLSSEIEEANVYTIAPERLEALGVRCHFGRRAAGLDRANKVLLLNAGESVPYDHLVVATGSAATRPPIPGIDGAHVYDHWTLADTRAIRSELERLGLAGRPSSDGSSLAGGARDPHPSPHDAEEGTGSRPEGEGDPPPFPGREGGSGGLGLAPHVAVIGGGFIGFTILNPLLHLGVRLTVIEREVHVLPRMINAEAAEVVEAWLRDRGVSVLTGAALEAVEDLPDGRKRLRLGDGGGVDADVVIVATGILPNLDWLRDSGIEIGRGIVVDDHLRSSDPSISAAGDVAEVVDWVTGRREVMAIETAAMEHGRVIGANLAGRERAYQGSMLMNVVEVAGLQVASFGDWLGGDASEGRAGRPHYRKYVWDGDRLAGGVMLGPARQIAGENDMGMLKGLIQAKTPLGPWKTLLVERPFELKKAFLATRTVGRLLPQTLLGSPSKPLDDALTGVTR